MFSVTTHLPTAVAPNMKAVFAPCWSCKNNIAKHQTKETPNREITFVNIRPNLKIESRAICPTNLADHDG